MNPESFRDHIVDVVSARRMDGLKRTYSTPRLIVHGTLQQITNNVGNGFMDFPQGSSLAG